MKTCRIILILAFSWQFAFGLELEFSASDINFSQEEGGMINGILFNFKNKGQSFESNSPSPLSIQIEKTDSEMAFSFGMFVFSFDFREYPLLDLVYQTNVKDSYLILNDDLIGFNARDLSFQFMHPIKVQRVRMNNFQIDCTIEDGDLKIACLNNGTLSPLLRDDLEDTDTEDETSMAEIQMESDTFNFSTHVHKFYTRANEIAMRGNELLFDAADIASAISQYQFDCYKRKYTTTLLDANNFLFDCFKQGRIKMDFFHLTSEKRKFSTLVYLDELRFSDKTISASIPSFDVHYDEKSLQGKGVEFYCQKKEMKEDIFDWEKAIDDCINDGHFTLDSLVYQSESSEDDLGNSKDSEGLNDPTGLGHSTIHLGQLEDVAGEQIESNRFGIQFKDTKININVPTLNYQSSEFNIDLEKGRISCDRREEFKRINQENILRNCFDASELSVGKIKIGSESSNSEIIVDSMSIDKNRLEFVVPHATYELNEEVRMIKDLSFYCRIEATFELAKLFEVGPFIDNCLRLARIEVGTIQSKEGILGKILNFYAADGVIFKSGKAICKKDDTDCIEEMSKLKGIPTQEHPRPFTLRSLPKVRLLFAKIPIGSVKFIGRVWYQKETEEIVLEVDKGKALIFNAKRVLLFLVKSFSKGGGVSVRRETVLINGKKVIKDRIYIKTTAIEKEDAEA